VRNPNFVPLPVWSVAAEGCFARANLITLREVTKTPSPHRPRSKERGIRLIADSVYRDSRTYVLQGQDTCLATRHLGTRACRRHSQKTASASAVTVPSRFGLYVRQASTRV
jgi:hypothetical protein